MVSDDGIYSNHLSSSLAKSTKFLWSTCNPGITHHPSTPFQTDTPLKHFLRNLPFFSEENPLRETRNADTLFFHVPTARNDWSFRMVFNERCPIPPAPEVNQKWGDLFPPSGFEAQNCCLQSLLCGQIR